MRKVAIAFCVLLFAAVAMAQTQSTFTFTEYPFPMPSSTHYASDPLVAPDGTVYVMQMNSQHLTHLYRLSNGTYAEVAIDSFPKVSEFGTASMTPAGQIIAGEDYTLRPSTVALITISGNFAHVDHIPLSTGNAVLSQPVTRADGQIWFSNGQPASGPPLPSAASGGFWHTNLPALSLTFMNVIEDAGGMHHMAVGSDGNIWYTPYFDPTFKIGRLTPDGTVTHFGTINERSLGSIALGTDGNIWYGGVLGGPYFGWYSMSGTRHDIVDFDRGPNPEKVGGYGDLVSGRDGNLWAGIGGSATKGTRDGLLRISTAGDTKFYPGRNSAGGTISVAPDAVFWFRDIPNKKIVSVTPPASDLFINGARYKVTLSAKDPRSGKTGIGQAFFQTNVVGYFSIPELTNNLSNPEVFVKVLGPVNGVPWVFFGGLTDFEYTITVVDSVTGKSTQYHKDPGNAKGGYDTGSGQGPAGTCPPNIIITAQGSSSNCTQSNSQLCLLGNRFKVELTARDQRTGKTAAGVTLPKNDLFGFFRLPDLTNDLTNVEVFVKVLDAGGPFWVFYGGLTDFEYTMKVTDTRTGKAKTYQKPAGSACGGFDTSGF